MGEMIEGAAGVGDGGPEESPDLADDGEVYGCEGGGGIGNWVGGGGEVEVEGEVLDAPEGLSDGGEGYQGLWVVSSWFLRARGVGLWTYPFLSVDGYV